LGPLEGAHHLEYLVYLDGPANAGHHLVTCSAAKR